MKDATFIKKGKLPDKDVCFCIYALKSGREIKVFATSQVLKDFNCDLKTVTRLALEQALADGLKRDEVHLTGKTYLAVKKKLRE